MTYFDCFVLGAWMFAIGWFLGAVYGQNHTEKTEHPRVALRRFRPRQEIHDEHRFAEIRHRTPDPDHQLAH